MRILRAFAVVAFTVGISDGGLAQPAPGQPMPPPSKVPPQSAPKRPYKERRVSCQKMMAEMGPGSTPAQKRSLRTLYRNCLRG